MTACFWTNLVGCRQDCDSDVPGAFAVPTIVSQSAPDPVSLVLLILPACGPCFGEEAGEDCVPIALVSATITSGTLWRDIDAAGCNVKVHCANNDGSACASTAAPNTLGVDPCAACSCVGTGTPCDVTLDEAFRDDTWSITDVDLVAVYDPDTSEYLGLGVPLSALLSPSTSDQPHYGELTVDTDIGAGFIWKIATGTCF